MFGPDVVVQQRVRFFGGVLHDALRQCGERNLDARRERVPGGQPRLNLVPQARELQVRQCQQLAGEPSTLAHEAEQQVLRGDLRRAELAGFVASEEKRPACGFGIAFEQGSITPATHAGDGADVEPVTPAITDQDSDDSDFLTDQRSQRLQHELQHVLPVAAVG